MIRLITTAAVLLALAAMSQAACAQDGSSPSLPGGASSLQETYEAWQISCTVRNKTRSCAMTQQQTQKESGRRVLAIELRSAADGALTGRLVLPFGLDLDAGVTLKIDDRSNGVPLRFKTCMPIGCVVPLALDAKIIDALRSGAALTVMTSAVDGKAVALPISLKGFSAAFDRLTALNTG